MPRRNPQAEPSSMRATLAVAKKEIVTSFRDRQTTLYTVVLPIALYPFVFWMMIQGSLFIQGRREHTEVRLGLTAAEVEAVPSGLSRALSTRPRPPEEETEATFASDPDIDHVSVDPLLAPLDEHSARNLIQPKQNRVREQGEDRGPDAVLWIAATRRDATQRNATQQNDTQRNDTQRNDTQRDDTQRDDTAAASNDHDARIFFDSTQNRSSLARARVAKRLPAFAHDLRVERAEAVGKTAEDLIPFVRDEAFDTAPAGGEGAYLLSFLLPMLLVTMTVMGAFYPAVDLTAGERERNTAETTMLLPIPRLAVHQGKILAVSASAVIATGLNLLAIGLSAEHLVGMMQTDGGLRIDLPIGALLAVAPLALLFAFFVSAVLTSVAALARTFKEGQALLGPVQMIFIFPAMAGVIPGLTLTKTLALVPVVNVVLAFRALLKKQVLPVEYALTAVSLLGFALVAMWVSVRILSRESLTVSEKSAGLRDWLRLWRSPGGVR